jgi:hypothetical protein
MDAKSPVSVIAFHPEERFRSAQADPNCLLPQNNPHGKPWLGLVQHLGLANTKQLFSARLVAAL